MVLAGNIGCVFLSVIETFAMNGLWLGWGQMTAIFKEKGMYQSYCKMDNLEEPGQSFKKCPNFRFFKDFFVDQLKFRFLTKFSIFKTFFLF